MEEAEIYSLERQSQISTYRRQEGRGEADNEELR